MREATCVNTSSNGFTKLFLEVAEDGKSLPVLRNDHVILFIKYFDIKEQRLR